jgi:hypothetical protein
MAVMLVAFALATQLEGLNTLVAVRPKPAAKPGAVRNSLCATLAGKARPLDMANRAPTTLSCGKWLPLLSRRL